jgi:mannose-1-phosphate guanylyltransferase
MKAFLLARRSWDTTPSTTDVMPKCLVPVQGQPLLEIWLNLCAGSGIDEVVINLHSHADAVEAYLRQREPPVKVRMVHEETLLGSAGTLLANRALVESDPVFWVLYSDVLTNTSLMRMAEFHACHHLLATVGLYRVPDPSRCGIAITNEKGLIVDFEENRTCPAAIGHSPA